ncbi:MAG: response regulator [Deltaproteobacteria bacterium]|nr:response regulator [Candidatus Anaeroferrophillus wilburensis]MBN2887885.1 response regulator [Deltaproteobacteria bacterium]
MKKALIAVIEDEVDIREVLEYNLEREGYRVISAADGIHGLKLVLSEQPDLVLLDLMLPGLGGLDICRRLQANEETNAIPIIMVSARGEESDIVVGLKLGADDYIAKPFSPKELLARVEAVLRRGVLREGKELPERLQYQGLTIDLARHEILVDNLPATLTATEFKLLHFLASHPGRVFTRDHLLNHITGGNEFIIDRNIDVHIQSIRKKLADHRNYIETIRGVGYRFRDQKG